MEQIKDLSRELNEYFSKVRKSCMKEPAGNLKHKFLDPGAGYQDILWDWDSYFCAMSAGGMPEIGSYLQGCVLNFLSHMREDGSIPYNIGAISSDIPAMTLRDSSVPYNTIKPVLAQMVLLCAAQMDDYVWIKDIFEKLEKYLWHWENTQKTCWGLFVWRSHRGSGTDNHPGVYGRQFNSSAGVDLNCMMYMEYLAMKSCAEYLGLDCAQMYNEKAENLKMAINQYMWDSIDEIYYHLDLSSTQLEKTNQPITWVVPLKFKAWTAFMPLWAGVAPENYADKMVKKHLLNKQEFWSSYGICSLAMNEPAYNIYSGGNPSDWQGPIWVVSNYIIFCGLIKYGYKNEAKELMQNLIGMLVRDLRENKMLSEYYHPDTGKGLCNPGFLNWNMLAGRMYEDFEKA